MDRRRAPARGGVRTTLRVPEDVFAEAQALAQELGTTPNDAIVRLARDGVEARRRRAQIRELAAARRAAVERSGFADATDTLPGPEDLRDAMLSGRADD